MIVEAKPLTVIAGACSISLSISLERSGTSVSGLLYLVMQIGHADYTILYGLYGTIWKIKLAQNRTI